jgi:hypothetical protein
VSNANSDLAALLQAELGETVAHYQLLKERTGRLDFLDLLIRARDLLVLSPSVRKHFQERFTHLFVDEFQDTDPLQAEILVLLSASDPSASNWRSVMPVPGKLFIVGDPKQAIYRFRRADVGTYEEVKQLLLKNGAELLQLTTSFRSLCASRSSPVSWRTLRSAATRSASLAAIASASPSLLRRHDSANAVGQLSSRFPRISMAKLPARLRRRSPCAMNSRTAFRNWSKALLSAASFGDRCRTRALGGRRAANFGGFVRALISRFSLRMTTCWIRAFSAGLSSLVWLNRTGSRISRRPVKQRV